jgi:hypothetical protein
VTIAHFQAKGGEPERRIIGSQQEPKFQHNDETTITEVFQLQQQSFLTFVKSWNTSYTSNKTPELLDTGKE